MALSSDLISQFVKITNDKSKKKTESIVYGTTVEYNGSMYVRLDGSDLLTPISTTTDMKAGERVTVMIKNHAAVVTGNISSPSARTDDVSDVKNKVDELDIDGINRKISEFETVVAGKVSTEQLEVEKGRIDNLETETTNISNQLTAQDEEIESLKTTVYHESKILWGEDLTTGMHMTSGHTISLTEAVSAQRYGIVLVFCAYNETENTNYSWQSFFVPKQLVTLSTSGHTFTLSQGKFTYIGTKYLYINDTSISGHEDNSLTGTSNGITYANNKFVLRYVIGV